MFDQEKFEDAIKRILQEQAESQIDRLISEALAQLVLGPTASHAFFGSLAMGMETITNDPRVQTAATDGERLFVNPQFFAAITPAQRVGTLCHEAFHAALDHVERCRGFNDKQRANKAADLSINPMVAETLELPEGVLFPKQFRFAEGLSLEEYYQLLPESKEGGEGEGGEDGNEFLDPPAPDPDRPKIPGAVRIQQALNTARERGELPGSLQGFVSDILKPDRHDWRGELWEYLPEILRSDSDWSRPSRRSESVGAYLPAPAQERTGCAVILVDTSGSCWRDLPAFAAVMVAIFAAFPLEVYIVYCDDEVHRVDYFPRGELEFEADASSFPGGGGTSHLPAFAEIEKRGIEPHVVVALTDLETDFPAEPAYPVIWASTARQTAPWGVVVKVTA